MESQQTDHGQAIKVETFLNIHGLLFSNKQRKSPFKAFKRITVAKNVSFTIRAFLPFIVLHNPRIEYSGKLLCESFILFFSFVKSSLLYSKNNTQMMFSHERNQTVES